MSKSKRKKSKSTLTIAEAAVHQLTKRWQKVQVSLMPNLFIAFDKATQESKRAVAFQFNKSVTNEIAELHSTNQVKNFIVHLGARKYKIKELENIPNRPFFVPILEVLFEDNSSNFYTGKWIPNDYPLSEIGNRLGVDSGEDAMPSAGASLFVLSWLEKHFENLEEPFIGIANGVNQKVKSYIFQEGESKQIASTFTGETVMNLYLGNGIRVISHPFAFRPILEVDETGTGENVEQGRIVGTSSYYDFSRPSPPFRPKN